MEMPIQTLEKKDFPPLLKEISDAPEKLFLRGMLPEEDTKLLTVVGSRKYSAYGKQATESLIEGLARKNIAIVSGLALGIDSIAHQSALAAGLKTIAVPGSGLGFDVLYPRTHQNLAKRILENGGALLSEFDEHFKARPESFPQRNRIMAGMSHATLVIEAGGRSGTLITARLALEYNRDLGVVPGGIFHAGSTGSNKLLQTGAFAVTDVDDICELLDLDDDTEENLSPETVNLSKEEKILYDLLAEPKTKDELFESLDNIPTHEANITLSGMEIRGILKVSGGKIYRI